VLQVLHPCISVSMSIVHDSCGFGPVSGCTWDSTTSPNCCSTACYVGLHDAAASTIRPDKGCGHQTGCDPAGLPYPAVAGAQGRLGQQDVQCCQLHAGCAPAAACSGLLAAAVAPCSATCFTVRQSGDRQLAAGSHKEHAASNAHPEGVVPAQLQHP
jgi:hypothetical protein